MLSWIVGSSFLREAVKKNGATALRRRRCLSWEMVPKMESPPPNAWDQVRGLSRLLGALAKRTS